MFTAMLHTWNPQEYSWDPESLIAAVDPVETVKVVSAKASGGGKRRTAKSKGQSPELFCQIAGCGARLETTYYRVSWQANLGAFGPLSQPCVPFLPLTLPLVLCPAEV